MAATDSLLANTASGTIITSILGTSNLTDSQKQGSLNRLDQLLENTIASTVRTTTVPGGGAVTVAAGANNSVSLVITAPAATTTSTGGTTGSMSTSPTQPLNFTIPANTAVLGSTVEKTDGPAAVAYVTSIVDKYIPNSAATSAVAIEQKNVLIAALTRAFALTKGQSTLNISVRSFDFISTGTGTQTLEDGVVISDGGVDSLIGANEVLLDASTSEGSQLFVVNLNALTATGKSLVLANVEGATLAAAGTMRVEGNNAIRVTSDNLAQNVTGGGGNDTLVGTGNDTLTGGAGNDVFGFSGAGRYTITDFNKTGDSLAFDIPGVTNLAQLVAKVTGVTTTSTSITYNLGADTSITLIGVSASDLTADMIKFSIS